MLKNRWQEFAPLCHLPDVTAINFIWVHTAPSICYHSSTEGQTDLFFAHSGVNHTESHLLNTSTNFPPDTLLYWHLNWKPVVANIPRNFREYKEEQKQFFSWKQWRSRALFHEEKDLRPASIHHQEFCRPLTTAIIYDSVHHLIRHPPWLGYMMDVWSYHSGFWWVYLVSELEVSWKTPARCKPASLLRDAQSQAEEMLQYCLWHASGLQLGSGRPILWGWCALLMRIVLSFLFIK